MRHSTWILDWNVWDGPDETRIRALKSMISIIRGYHLAMGHLNVSELATEIFLDRLLPGSAMAHFLVEKLDFLTKQSGLLAK